METTKKGLAVQVEEARLMASEQTSKTGLDALGQFIYLTVLKRQIEDELQVVSSKAILQAISCYPAAQEGKHFTHEGYELSCHITDRYDTLGSYSATYRNTERERIALQEQVKQKTKELKTLQSSILLEHPGIKPTETKITLALYEKE